MKIKTLCFINTSIKIEMANNKFTPHFKNSDLLPKKYSFSKKKQKNPQKSRTEI